MSPCVNVVIAMPGLSEFSSRPCAGAVVTVNCKVLASVSLSLALSELFVINTVPPSVVVTGLFISKYGTGLLDKSL